VIVAPFKVVLDACVLFPFSLRDTLLRAAAEGMYQLYWSEQILEETRRSLVEKKITEEQADRLLAAMTGAFPEAMVTDYDLLVPAMPNHEEDRHVAAAAVKAGAQVIVTVNLKHFQTLTRSVEAQSPDEFLSDLFDLDPDGVVEILRAQAAALVNPHLSFEELVDSLAQIVPDFARAVRGQE
jgi:predicted nucleic acid-binding protein